MALQSCPSTTELSEFVLGTLPRPIFERLAHHVERCAACDTALQALDGVSDSLLSQLKHPGSKDATSSIPEQILARVRSLPAKPSGLAGMLETDRRRLGNFELLEELGLGSFG